MNFIFKKNALDENGEVIETDLKEIEIEGDGSIRGKKRQDAIEKAKKKARQELEGIEPASITIFTEETVMVKRMQIEEKEV